MGAGASREQITRKKRQLLQRIARETGGRYTAATATKAALVFGKDEGERTVSWTATYGHGNMSNGETVLTLEVQCWIDPSVGPPTTFRNMTVPGAVLAYRLTLAADAQAKGADLATQSSFLDGDEWEGQPGDMARLFGHGVPFSHVFGRDFCLTHHYGQGFDLLDKKRQALLAFKGESADFWSRDLFVAIRPDLRPLSRPNHYNADAYRAADKSEAELSRRRADGLDAFAVQFEDADGWVNIGADWRLGHGPKDN